MYICSLAAAGALQWAEHGLNLTRVWWVKVRDQSLIACTLLSKAGSE